MFWPTLKKKKKTGFCSRCFSFTGHYAAECDRRDERHSEESITEDNPRYTLEMR